MRPIVRPDALDLDSPGRRDYLVALEHDTLWGDHLIPLSVLVGPKAEAGRGLVAFGSVHGSEMEGPVALKGLLREIDPAKVLGRIIVVPVLNPSAFADGTRDSPADGVNLNRAFVDGAGAGALGGITHRIAAFVRAWIWPRVHVVVDIHSCGETLLMPHLASFHPIADPALSRATEETARWFGTPFVMNYQNATPGLLTSEAERLGKITVGTELGWGNTVDRAGVRYARQGVLAAAIRHGQLAGEIAPIAHHRDQSQKLVSIVDRACFVTAPHRGHYEPVIEVGEPARAGDLLGRYHDFDRIDEPPLEVRAPVDGVVFVRAWRNPVPRGQNLVAVARVIG